MIRESEIRQKLRAFLWDELSLDAFEKWLDDASWSMHNDSNPDAVRLVSAIHALLSERDDHVLSESELRLELEALGRQNVVRLNVLIDFDHAAVVSEPDPVISEPEHWAVSQSFRVPEMLVPLASV